jgi:hypothetical protein
MTKTCRHQASSAGGAAAGIELSAEWPASSRSRRWARKPTGFGVADSRPGNAPNVGANQRGRVGRRSGGEVVRPGDRVEAGTGCSGSKHGQRELRAEAELAAAREAGESVRYRNGGPRRRTEVERFDDTGAEARIDAERTRKAGSLLGSGSGSNVLLATTEPCSRSALPLVPCLRRGMMSQDQRPTRWLEADVSEDDAADHLRAARHGRVVARRDSSRSPKCSRPR